jgi:hypothetical protein
VVSGRSEELPSSIAGSRLPRLGRMRRDAREESQWSTGRIYFSGVRLYSVGTDSTRGAAGDALNPHLAAQGLHVLSGHVVILSNYYDR